MFNLALFSVAISSVFNISPKGERSFNDYNCICRHYSSAMRDTLRCYFL